MFDWGGGVGLGMGQGAAHLAEVSERWVRGELVCVTARRTG